MYKFFYLFPLLLLTAGCSVTLGGARSALYLPFDDRDAVIVINDGDGALDVLVNENVVRESLPPGKPYPVRVPCLNGMSNYQLLITVLAKNPRGEIVHTFSRVMSGYCYGSNHYQRVEPWTVSYGLDKVQSGHRWLTPGVTP